MKPTRFHHPLSNKDLVALTIKEMESIPPGSNPYHHDHWRMGTSLTSSYTAMFNSSEKPTEHLVLVNHETGQRFMIEFEPAELKWRMVVKFVEKLDKILGEECFLFSRTHHTTSSPDTDYAVYHSVDGANYTEVEAIYDLWFLHKGYMVQVRALCDKAVFKEEWDRSTYESELTPEELEELYGKILDATPNCTYVRPVSEAEKVREDVKRQGNAIALRTDRLFRYHTKDAGSENGSH